MGDTGRPEINLDLRFKTVIPPLIQITRHMGDGKGAKHAQLEILHALLKIEVGIRRIKAEMEDEQTAKEISVSKSNLETLLRMHLLVKMIGSIIPWNCLESYEITALSENEPPGFISGKTGFGNEFRLFLNNCGKDGNIIILNDLTHCLTIGDVVIVHSDGSADLVEVKAGKRKRVRGLQKQKMGGAIDYMHSGINKNPSHLRYLTSSYSVIKHNWSVLESILRDAKSSGFSVRHPQPSLTYVAYNPTHQKVDERLEELMQKDLLFRESKPIRACSLSDTIDHANDMRHIPPPTVFKINDKLLLDILDGKLNVITFFSPFHPLFLKRVNERGLSLHLLTEEKLRRKGGKWSAITTGSDGKKRYLACKYPSYEEPAFVDHSALIMLYTFETEQSFLNGLIALELELPRMETIALAADSLQDDVDFEPAEQSLRPWAAKKFSFKKHKERWDSIEFRESV